MIGQFREVAVVGTTNLGQPSRPWAIHVRMVRTLIRLVGPMLLLSLVAEPAIGEDGFPAAESKKGLQVQMVDDALALGIKHAAINVDLCGLADLAQDPSNPSVTVDGRSYRFQKRILDRLDRTIKPLSDKGVLVYLILLSYQSADPAINKLVLHPSYDKACPNHLGAFNSATAEGRQWFKACVTMLSTRWSGADSGHGRVVGYIIGNEVNSHWWWSNMGRVTMDEFAREYATVVRLAHQGVRSASPWARVYLSLEHHWNIRYSAGDEKQSFAARPFLECFAAVCREQGDFDWNIAFHPYPENLGNPRFWRDKSATFQSDTPRITFKNLEMLDGFLKQPSLRHQNAQRRVILSEQGFHTPDGPNGETIQAAAYCYAWKKIEKLDGIDAFILHRHVDHSGEGGLKLGLWRNKPGSVADPDGRKRIYECFKDADTPRWRQTFEFALPVVGLKNWDEAATRPAN